MIGGGIARRGLLHDDCRAMTNHLGATLQEHGSAGFAICEARALATRMRALLDDLDTRIDGAFADGPADACRLGADELAELAAAADDLAEVATQTALALDGLPLAPLTVDEQEIAEAARTVLADGVADLRRACSTASLLTADRGFPALAEALIESDAHASWEARVVEVIAAFRDVDDVRARQVVALAGVSQEARFDELRPERVLELANTLRQLAGR
jgi:hypothetical protein